MCVVASEKAAVGRMASFAAEKVVVVGRMASFAGRTYSVVKSDVGLLIILFAYSFLGAVVLHHAEYETGRQRILKLDQHKNDCISGIVNASAAAFSQHAGPYVDDDERYKNLSEIVEALVDDYIDQKEELRPISNAPEWTYWGALFFCGTVFTTVGEYCKYSISYIHNDEEL